jgi:hypothetical protein
MINKNTVPNLSKNNKYPPKIEITSKIKYLELI